MSELLNVMIVPFQQKQAVLVPKELIEYVLPYAPPLPSSYSHTALIGSLIYKNEKVPVLDLGMLYSGQPTPLSEIDGNRRIVIVSRLNHSEEFSSYALLATRAPSMVELAGDELQETDDEVPNCFYSRVELAQRSGQSQLIVDFPRLEAELFA